MTDLTGKRALVTGASGGIGAAIARQLHGAGPRWGFRAPGSSRWRHWPQNLARAPMCCLAISLIPKRSRRCQSAPSRRWAGRHPGQQCRDHPRRAVHADVGCRLAGRSGREPDRRDAAVARRAARHDEGTLGRIVNIGSVVGTTGNPGQANYVAAKAGMVGMTKALAIEVATRGVTANAVAPGFIATAMTDKLNETQKAAILGQIPSGRMGTPRTLRRLCCFWPVPRRAMSPVRRCM